MRKLFADPKKIKLLESQVESWLGTPYRHMAAQRGIAVDCVHFIENICKDVGIIREIKGHGEYRQDWYKTRDDAIINTIEWYITDYLCDGVESVTTKSLGFDRPFPGDLLCYRIHSPVINHVGMAMEKGMVVHASTRARKVVIESQEAYKFSLKRIYSWEVA